MTESEAKVILESEYKFHGECSVFGEALTTAINALEKQIPKKLKDYTQPQYGCIPVCGVCNGIMDLMQGDLNYCPNCGQAIDWSDKE